MVLFSYTNLGSIVDDLVGINVVTSRSLQHLLDLDQFQEVGYLRVVIVVSSSHDRGVLFHFLCRTENYCASILDTSERVTRMLKFITCQVTLRKVIFY